MATCPVTDKCLKYPTCLALGLKRAHSADKSSNWPNNEIS